MAYSGSFSPKVLLAFFLLIPLSLFAYTAHEEQVPMRDSVLLATTVYLPSATPPPWPVILQRTPYNRSFEDTVIYYITDALGYAFVSQNLRGTRDSGGEPRVFLSDGWGDLQDGWDCIEWIVGQEWCNGDIGMFGASAPGMTQYYAAGTGHPNLKCIAPVLAGPSIYHHVAYQGGCFRKALVESWLSGLGFLFLADTIAQHPMYSEFWEGVNLAERWDEASMPSLHFAGWFDMYTDGQIEAFTELKARHGNQGLIIAPWGHGNAVGTNIQGDIVFPENAIWHELELVLVAVQWYSRWLKEDSTYSDFGEGVYFYLMGDCDTDDTTYWNHWEFSENWPVAGMEYENYYLHSDLSISPYPPTDSADFTYTYDPDDPSPTIGGREFVGLGSAGYGPKNQAPIVEAREDVVIFSTPPLEEPLKLVGKIKCILYASSDRIDTDFAVRITDVYPDGRSILLTDGILKARHRIALDREDFLEPDEVYEFEIDCWSVGYVFNEGHRLRAIVSSSNFPRFEVNPNTGAPLLRNDPERLIATNTIHLSPTYSCKLELPVVPLIPLNFTETRPLINKPEQITISAYPNPFNSAVRIVLSDDDRKIEGSNNITVEIFDLTGRCIERQSIPSGFSKLAENRESGRSFLWIPHESTPSGVYLVRAQKNEGQIAAKRIVFMK